MERREQVLKALQDLSTWGQDHWFETEAYSGPAGAAKYRAFIQKTDQDLDSLCNEILFVLADTIVQHRRTMKMDAKVDYLRDYNDVIDRVYGDTICMEDLVKNDQPTLSERNVAERFKHRIADDLPQPKYLQEVIINLIEWADEMCEAIEEVQTTEEYDHFMVNLDVSFDELLKCGATYDLNRMIPLLSKPEEKCRPILEHIEDMLYSTSPWTWTTDGLEPDSLPLASELVWSWMRDPNSLSLQLLVGEVVEAEPLALDGPKKFRLEVNPLDIALIAGPGLVTSSLYVHEAPVRSQ